MAVAACGPRRPHAGSHAARPLAPAAAAGAAPRVAVRNCRRLCCCRWPPRWCWAGSARSSLTPQPAAGPGQVPQGRQLRPRHRAALRVHAGGLGICSICSIVCRWVSKCSILCSCLLAGSRGLGGAGARGVQHHEFLRVGAGAVCGRCARRGGGRAPPLAPLPAPAATAQPCCPSSPATHPITRHTSHHPPQDYRVHIKHTDGSFEYVPYFCLPGELLFGLQCELQAVHHADRLRGGWRAGRPVRGGCGGGRPPAGARLTLQLSSHM